MRLELSYDGARSMLGAPAMASAVVVGSQRDVAALLASPPIFRYQVSADAADTVRLELRPEDVRLPPDVHVTVRTLRPTSVALTFAPKSGAAPKSAAR